MSGDKLVGILATTIRRESSKKIVADLTAVNTEAGKVATRRGAGSGKVR